MTVKINEVAVGADCFPNNERIFKVNDLFDPDELTITLNYQTDLDITRLVMAKKYLDDASPATPKILDMKYVPYSRMDRKIRGYAFTLKYFCQLINDLKFDQVRVLDPHSPVTPALLDRVSELDVRRLILKAMVGCAARYLFFPDAGAYKRYTELIGKADFFETFYGVKARDLNTGKITKFEIPEHPDLMGQRVLIVDDLCAFGNTFMQAARALTELGAEVYLYVSHCESSIYQGEVLRSDLIKKVFTTDSILTDWSHPKLTRVDFD